MASIIKRSLLTLALLGVSGPASFGFIVVKDGVPVNPPIPPEQVEPLREAQQAEAPMLEENHLAKFASGKKNRSPSAAPAPVSDPDIMKQALAANLQSGQSASKAEVAEEPAPGRTKGAILIITATAGMFGLVLGRAAFSAVSRTSAREAEEALAPVKQADNSKDLGGDHREYYIE